MDSNKDEALRCVRIAEEAIVSGNKQRALKFIGIAQRLNHNLSVGDLLAACERLDEAAAPPPPAVDGNGVDQNRNESVRSKVGEVSNGEQNYTEEHVELIRKIRRNKDYYGILGVEKSCSVEEIRKAYRKLSLKVHPDKNKAPGAEEAFKAVSKAFQCLSNEESRKKYDLVGSDEPVYERHPATRRANGFNGFYDGDVDAEEIFRNFFFGGMPQATTQFRGFAFGPGMGTRTGNNDSGGFNIRALIQLLPVLIILLLNFLPSSEPMYAFARSYPYEYRFVTQKGVNYYVKSTKFEQDYPSNSHERVAFEARVEREYFALLSQNCRHELQRLQWGFIRETPHCDMLK